MKDQYDRREKELTIFVNSAEGLTDEQREKMREELASGTFSDERLAETVAYWSIGNEILMDVYQNQDAWGARKSEKAPSFPLWEDQKYVFDKAWDDTYIKLNAYFGGLGNSKRVVLFDTLLEKISEDGLIAILGHELGHFKHKDILCNIVIAGSIMFIVFAIMGLFFESLCEYLGLYESHGTILILAMLFLPALTFIIKPIQNYFSRKAEYKADAFGASCVSKKALSQALIRLVNENKAFPHSHPAFIFFYYSHPPLLERLKALENLND